MALGRRWSGTLLVFLVVYAILAGLVTLFVVPPVNEGSQVARNFRHRPPPPGRTRRHPAGRTALYEASNGSRPTPVVACRADSARRCPPPPFDRRRPSSRTPRHLGV